MNDYYIVLSNSNLDVLIGDVGERMRQGYKCLGGVQIATFAHQNTNNFGALSTDAVYYQTMAVKLSDLSGSARSKALEEQEYFASISRARFVS